nr:hypothetical transcript [Hymenolepis microstoma]
MGEEGGTGHLARNYCSYPGCSFAVADIKLSPAYAIPSRSLFRLLIRPNSTIMRPPSLPLGCRQCANVCRHPQHELVCASVGDPAIRASGLPTDGGAVACTGGVFAGREWMGRVYSRGAYSLESVECTNDIGEASLNSGHHRELRNRSGYKTTNQLTGFTSTSRLRVDWLVEFEGGTIVCTLTYIFFAGCSIDLPPRGAAPWATYTHTAKESIKRQFTSNYHDPTVCHIQPLPQYSPYLFSTFVSVFFKSANHSSVPSPTLSLDFLSL